jgi:hypothetical protein
MRKRDHFSPIILNIVVDMLTILIARDEDDSQVSGLIPHLVDGVYLSYTMMMIPFYLWSMI